MSKSKLNRRQLKKISKIACDALISLEHIDHFNTWFDEEEAQWVLSRSNVVNYDFDLCIDDLQRAFNSLTDSRYNKRKIKARSAFKALSKGSQIHCMIKFLEGNQ